VLRGSRLTASHRRRDPVAADIDAGGFQGAVFLFRRAEDDDLGADGEAGVAKALDLIRNELLVTMGLCGVNTIAEIDDRVLAI